MPLESLLRRIITTRGGLDFYESGRDIGMSTDLYQSFKLYQSHIMTEYEHMVEEYHFKVVAADEPVDTVQKSLRSDVRKLLADNHSGNAASHLNSSTESITKVTGP